jgi:hypothetical protein
MERHPSQHPSALAPVAIFLLVERLRMVFARGTPHEIIIQGVYRNDK